RSLVAQLWAFGSLVMVDTREIAVFPIAPTARALGGELRYRFMYLGHITAQSVIEITQTLDHTYGPRAISGVNNYSQSIGAPYTGEVFNGSKQRGICFPTTGAISHPLDPILVDNGNNVTMVSATCFYDASTMEDGQRVSRRYVDCGIGDHTE